MQSRNGKDMRYASVSEILQDVFVHKAAVPREHGVSKGSIPLVHGRIENFAQIRIGLCKNVRSLFADLYHVLLRDKSAETHPIEDRGGIHSSVRPRVYRRKLCRKGHDVAVTERRFVPVNVDADAVVCLNLRLIVFVKHHHDVQSITDVLLGKRRFPDDARHQTRPFRNGLSLKIGNAHGKGKTAERKEGKHCNRGE